MNASSPGDDHCTTRPLISVIIPAYNAARYIGRTLKSVLAQTHAQIDVVVVDDGSTDDTAAVVAKFQDADQRIRLIRVANGGVARARNRGIAESRGCYLAFIDADDLWKPEKLAKQLAEIESSGPDYGAVYTLHYVIDEDDRIVRAGNGPVATGFILSRHLAFRFVGNGSALLVRRESLLATTLFDPSYADAGIGGCEDLDLELKLAERFKIAAVAERLVGYRIHEGNMSSDRKRMAKSLIEVNRRAIERNSFLSPQARRQIRISQYRYAFESCLRGRFLAESCAYGRGYLFNDPLRFAILMVDKMIKAASRKLGKPLLSYPRAPVGLSFELATQQCDVLQAGGSVAWRTLNREDCKRELALYPSSADGISIKLQ